MDITLPIRRGRTHFRGQFVDAEMLIKEGKARTVLVGCHDESTHLFNSLLKRDGAEEFPFIHSIAMVLSCGE